MYFDAYISDLHISHTNIIKYCNRPYSTVEEMNESIIENYNKKIRSNDNVLFLGDIFFTKNQEYIKNVIKRLNGSKHLLRGNHDHKWSDLQLYDFGFDSVYKTDFLGSISGHAVRYSHYPYYSLEGDQGYIELRPKKEISVILIHGHTHEKDKITSYGTLHVGVDAWDMSPATYDEVKDLLNTIK
jgi:calcineurin-like phosphoesterase family protein